MYILHMYREKSGEEGGRGQRGRERERERRRNWLID